MGLKAQTTCLDDRVAYVDSKNTGSVGAYTLSVGLEEEASQAYHYSGPGKVGGARIYGDVPLGLGVILKVSIYNVDANDRPTGSALATAPLKKMFAWSPPYFDVSFSPSVSVSADFALVVEIVNAPGWGHDFALHYTGNGEGLGEDLASLAGTSTGSNWASAMTSFHKDGDFYLYPRMVNFNTPMFTIPANCINTGASVSFTNTTEMTKDPMFNKITAAGHTGSNTLYSWDFGDGSLVSTDENPTHIYTTPGVYTVVLTSMIEGWDGNCTETFSRSISVGLATSANSITDVTCNGGNNGSVVGVSSGGAAPYQYSLNGEDFQTASLFEGLISAGYTLYTKDDLGCIKTTAFTILQPTAIQFTSTTSTNATCGNTDGAILVESTGGVSPIEYQLNTGVFQSSGSFTSLHSGGYTITAKDAHGCTSSNIVVVNDFGGPTFNIVNPVDVSCFGGNDGSISLSSIGGTGLIQYSIDGGNIFQTSGAFTNVTANKYTAIVKDAAGCTDIQLVCIKQAQQLNLAASTVDLTCNGSENGQINVTSVSGGTGAITYSLNGVGYQSDKHFSGLSAGTYEVFARDITGCVNSVIVTVEEPTVLSATVSVTNATCNGSQDGSILVLGNGGTPGYTYSIGSDEKCQSNSTFGNLEANSSYTLVVTDANKCVYRTFAIILQPTAVLPVATTTNSTCGNSNGGILVSATRGSGSGYLYSIDGGLFGNGLFSSLSAGVYVITAKDDLGCMTEINATVFDSDGPSIVSSNHTNVNCNNGRDGSISVGLISGGTGALLYSINGVSYQSTTLFNRLSAGIYDLIVKDAVGCIGHTEIEITEPNAFVINSDVTNVFCNDRSTGVVTLLVGGGSGTLAYSINGGLTYQSSNTFTQLQADQYNFLVKDAGGCTGNKNVFITQPTAMTIEYSALNIFCNGQNNGILNVHANGGVGSIIYSLDGNTFQNSNEFTDLYGGSYTIYTRDQNGCISTFPAVVAEPAEFTIEGNVSNVTCAGGNNGVIDISVNGGTPGFEFSWSNGVSTEDNFNLIPGTYSVDISDQHGCSVTRDFTITEPLTPVIVNGSITNATSPSNGSIDITVTGGVGNYTYLWSNSSISEDLSSLSLGTYTVVVTDENGCSASSTFVVTSSAGIKNVGEISNEVVVYPNPANDIITIEGKDVNIDKIEILNVLGQLTFSSEFKGSKVQINTSNLDQGVYFVKIHSAGKSVMKSLRIID